MKYIYYNSKDCYLPGWIVTDTKAKHSDLCGKGWIGFANSIRCYLWYLGVTAKIAFYSFKKKNK